MARQAHSGAAMVQPAHFPNIPMSNPSRQGTATLAVLIDADNAGPAIIEGLLAEVAKYGVAAVKRIYGDWTKPNLSGWKECLLSHSIQPIQQFRYTVGKNATDSAMIIDAMDLLYTERFDGFCLVSSDSDFTRLASRIREQGLTVYGFGERKTPKPFVTACDRFIYADVLRAESVGADTGEAEEAAPAVKRRSGGELRQDSRLVRLLQNAAQAVSDEDGWATLGALGSHIAKQAPEFDSRNYGYGKLSELVNATGLFDMEQRNGGNNRTLWARLKRRVKAPQGQQAPAAVPAPAPVAAPKRGEAGERGERGERGQRAERGERGGRKGRGTPVEPVEYVEREYVEQAEPVEPMEPVAPVAPAAPLAQPAPTEQATPSEAPEPANAADPAEPEAPAYVAAPEARPAYQPAQGLLDIEPVPPEQGITIDTQPVMEAAVEATTPARPSTRRKRAAKRPEVALSETPWPIEASVFAAPGNTVLTATVQAPEAADLRDVAEPAPATVQEAVHETVQDTAVDPTPEAATPAKPARKRRAPAKKAAAKAAT